MFGFLKDKLKGALKKFSKKVDEEAETEEVVVEKKVKKPVKKPTKKPAKKKEVKKKEVKKKEKPVKEKVVKKKKEKPVKEKIKEPTIQPPLESPPEDEVEAEPEEEITEPTQPTPSEPPEEVEEPVVEEEPEEEPEKKGFFGKLKTKIFGGEEEEEKEVEPEPTVEEKEEAHHPPPPEAQPEEEVEEEPEPPAKETTVPSRPPPPVQPEKAEEEVSEEPEEVEEPVVEEEPEEKKGFFARLTEKITTKKLSEKQFDELFWELEVALLENNVAVEVIEKIKQDLKKVLVDQQIKRGKLEETIVNTLMQSIGELFDVPSLDLIKEIKNKKPYVIAFIGVNGSGKTTTIAKLAHYFKEKGLKPVVVAADTFRAAAIQQLEQHTTKVGVKLIKHDYGADPAAVAFDGVKYAQNKGMDVVLIDTAGRLHSNTNLMDEMKKIIRVAKPDIKIFIGEAITGNDCVEQATQFNNAVGIDGIVLCKADVDEKGGAAISVSYVTGKPILYLGVGQEYKDLKPFDKSIVLENIGL